MSLIYTEAELETLRKVRVSGSLEVQFSDGRRVRYRSLEEIDAILADADTSVNPSSTLPVRRVHVNMEDGF